MKMRVATLWFGVALAACGGDGGDQPDALQGVDAVPSDAAADDCDYTESDDDGNATTAEATGLDVPGAIKICGSVAARAPTGQIVDTDRYAFTVQTAGPYLVRVDAPAGGVLALSAGVSLAAGGDGAFRNDGVYIGDHLVFSVGLEAAEFAIEMIAGDNAAPDSAVPYTITIVPDQPAARCATVSGDAAYTEATDTATNAGNDMVEVTWGPFAAVQTAATTDAPEPSASALTISAGMSYKASGAAGIPNGGATDSYQDRDTYVIATGAQTNEITVRLSWEGTDADLDFLVLAVPQPTAAPVPLAFGTLAGTTGPEFATTAALRSTQYWLWVGEFDSAVPVDKPYDLTICGYDYSSR
jgi:hypothetical protein